jgi:uncharacterized membrane protein
MLTRDRAAATAFALVAVAGALASVGGAGNLGLAILAAAAIIVIPGSVLMLALFPDFRVHPPPSILGVGLGFAAISFAGILLHITETRIERTTWAALLVALIVIASIAIVLYPHTASPLQITDTRRVADPGPSWRLRPAQLALLATSLLLVAASIRITTIGLAAQPHPGFTQLWIMPGSEPHAAEVGILNAEGSRETYRLRVMRGTAAVAEWTIVLDSGRRWLRTVEVGPGTAEPLEARLYRSGVSEVYRHVWLWPKD